ncbi:MAG: hypothetical protein IKA36_04790 [Clostridia bacterium]|nr:hypothetical protein [Clostridia bacterium]
MKDVLPISMKDLKTKFQNYIGYYDWENIITFRSKISGNSIVYKSAGAYTASTIINGVQTNAVEVGAPTTGQTGYPSTYESSSGYTRKLKTLVRGMFRVTDGSNTVGLLRNGKTDINENWVTIVTGGSEQASAVSIDVFPGDKIIIRSAKDEGGTADPHVVQFIPWKSAIL